MHRILRRSFVGAAGNTALASSLALLPSAGTAPGVARHAAGVAVYASQIIFRYRIQRDGTISLLDANGETAANRPICSRTRRRSVANAASLRIGFVTVAPASWTSPP